MCKYDKNALVKRPFIITEPCISNLGMDSQRALAEHIEIFKSGRGLAQVFEPSRYVHSKVRVARLLALKTEGSE